MINLDKNTVRDLENRKIKKIFLYFYDAGCSGTKINLKEDFNINSDLEKYKKTLYSFDIYLEKKDLDKFENVNITKVIKSDHTGKEKISYIFSNDKVKQVCGCGSSFSFEDKKISIDFNKLKNLKNNFK